MPGACVLHVYVPVFPFHMQPRRSNVAQKHAAHMLQACGLASSDNPNKQVQHADGTTIVSLPANSARSAPGLSSEHGTHKTVEARLIGQTHQYLCYEHAGATRRRNDDRLTPGQFRTRGARTPRHGNSAEMRYEIYYSIRRNLLHTYYYSYDPVVC